MKPFNNVTEKIVPADICVGCGLCQAVCPHTTLDMQDNPLGEFQPVVVNECYDKCTLCMDVCPFDDHSQDEDVLGLSRYGEEADVQHDLDLGYFQSAYVGYDATVEDRTASASGGLTSLFLKELLKRGEVDAVIVPQPTGDGKPWFEMTIVDSVEQIEQSRGSIYSPAHMGDVLREVTWGPDRTYAIVALPCYAKAIRLAQEKFPKLRKRIKFVLGLVCGGAKNLQVPQLLSTLGGGENPVIDFRSKQGANAAPDFRFTTKKDDQITSMIRFRGLFGFLWVNDFGSLRSCQFCDDVFAELADIVFMDAWLPDYLDDRLGTSLVICRNKQVDQLMQQTQADQLWVGESIAPELVAQSQKGVKVKKCNPLPARISVAREKGFVPVKRCEKEQTLNAISEAQLNLARKQLELLDWGKQAFLKTSSKWENKPRGWLRLLAWFFCLRYFTKMRSMKIPVKRTKSVLLLNWLPSPRMLVRKLIRFGRK